MRFLLTGGVALSDELPDKPRDGDWISAKSWGEIHRLSLMDKFDMVMKSFHAEGAEWKRIYDSKEPQS